MLSSFPWNVFFIVCLFVTWVALIWLGQILWHCGSGTDEIIFWDKKQQKCIIRKRWLDTFWYQIAEEVGVRVIVIGRHIYLPKREKTLLWIACFSYILINLRSQPEAMKIFWKKMRKCWSATLRFFLSPWERNQVSGRYFNSKCQISQIKPNSEPDYNIICEPWNNKGDDDDDGKDGDDDEWSSWWWQGWWRGMLWEEWCNQMQIEWQESCSPFVSAQLKAFNWTSGVKIQIQSKMCFHQQIHIWIQFEQVIWWLITMTKMKLVRVTQDEWWRELTETESKF